MTTLSPLKIVLLGICLVGFPIAAFWLGWNFLDASNRAKTNVSQDKFEQLAAALAFYHHKHGSFPPTKYQPVVGGPIHSWRVFLLLDTGWNSSKRHAGYDFSHEWNSTNNLQALGQKAPSYLRFNSDGDTTDYLAIGDGDEWPSKKPLRSRLITKGKDRFLLVEYPDSEIHWMEPKY